MLTQTSVNENSKLTNPVYAQQILENFDETYARTSINISIHDENLMNSITNEHEENTHAPQMLENSMIEMAETPDLQGTMKSSVTKEAPSDNIDRRIVESSEAIHVSGSVTTNLYEKSEI